MESPDQRRNVRIQLLLCGQLSLGGGENYGIETQNLSLKGARIDPHPALQGLGRRRCILTLFADVRGACAITFDGWMIYAGGHGCGIEFQAVDRHDFRMFKDLMREHAPEPGRLRREVEQDFIPALEDWAVAASSPRPPAPGNPCWQATGTAPASLAPGRASIAPGGHSRFRSSRVEALQRRGGQLSA